ncbi:MAG: elongation factor G [Nannocystaceae bacterium]
MSPRAVFINFPLYLEDGGQNPRLVGVVDVVTGQALRFAGTFGETVEVGPCPPELLSTLHQAREQLLETLAEVDDTILADLIDGVEPSMKVIKKVIRQATIQGQVTPVLCGSAYHQVGVQPLLDAVVAYLPAPEERTRVAESIDDSSAVTLDGGIEGALCAFAFKVDDGDFGQLTYVRIIQGKLVRGMRVVNTRTGKRLRIGRLGRMHAATMEELQVAYTGDIVVVFGLACGHGDTLTDGELRCSLSPIVVPDPVMAVAISQRTRARTGHGQLAKALGRFVREDPSFRVHRDPESGETIISGMGELHLEVYIERLRREHGLEVEVSAPEVAYRESIARPAQITHTHKKQDGGHGQYARVQGSLRPTGGDAPMEVGFTASIRGGAITKEYLPACEQGFADALKRGILIGAPVLGVTLELVDGATHEKDSSPLAFRLATRDAVRAALRVAEPIILEPVMEVEVTTPTSHHGNVVGSLVQRRGRIMHHESTTNSERIVATVPLAEMFGYAGHLRSLTQGQGCFSMHFAHYGQVPSGHVRSLIERFGSRAAR